MTILIADLMRPERERRGVARSHARRRHLRASPILEDAICPSESEESRDCRDPYRRQEQLDGVTNSGARSPSGVNRTSEIVQAMNAMHGVHPDNPYASAHNQRGGKQPVTSRFHFSPHLMAVPPFPPLRQIAETPTAIFVVMKKPGVGAAPLGCRVP